jgi:hypothetical protein
LTSEIFGNAHAETIPQRVICICMIEALGFSSGYP